MKLLLIIWICSTATLFLACGCFIFFEADQFDKDLTKEMKVISSFIADIGMYSDRLGAVYIEADRRVLHERIKKYAVIVVGIMAVSSLLIAAISFVLQKIISKPIMSLVSSAKEVAEKKDYSIRVKKHSEDELGVQQYIWQRDQVSRIRTKGVYQDHLYNP